MCVHACAVAKHRLQPTADVFEADAAALALDVVRIPRVLNGDRQPAVIARDVKTNHAPLERSSDPVRNRVLDERLQNERRHEALGGSWID